MTFSANSSRRFSILRKILFGALACAVAITGFFAPRIVNDIPALGIDGRWSEMVTMDANEDEATAQEGDCLPADFTDSSRAFGSLVVGCSGPEAYWRIFAIDSEPVATTDPDGDLDWSYLENACGAGALRPRAGAPITFVTWTWNEDLHFVESLHCLEAVERNAADGTVPRYPRIGDCVTELTKPIDCGASAAVGEVVSAEELAVGEDLSEADLLKKSSSDCSSLWSAWEYDRNGEAALFYCVDRS